MKDCLVYMDKINAVFIGIAGIILWFNVWKLLKDKTVKGFSWQTQLFFTFTGLWNIVYYANIQQRYSFFFSISAVMANGVWTFLAFYYSRYK